jgi:hypothetical protein
MMFSQTTVNVPASNAVTTSTIADGNVTTAKINDDAVTLAKMAGLARGKLIVGDASGNPSALALGSANYVLTSDGNDAVWAASQVEESPTFTGNVAVGGTFTVTGLSTLSGLAYPTADGSSGQVLQTNGSGTLSFATVSGGPAFKTFGTDSIMIGDTTTGTIDAANDNTGLGVDVFAALTSGDSNVAIGKSALTANTTGTGNTAVGATASDAMTTGTYSTSLGFAALSTATTPNYNVAIGASALQYTTTGYQNTAVGTSALAANTTGADNVAVGFAALDANTTASNCSAVGISALGSNTTGENNTAVGSQALAANTTAAANVAVGHAALFVNTTGSDNTAVGKSAMISNTTGTKNTALGKDALKLNTTGDENTAVGSEALDANTTGTHNVAIGREAMGANTGGYENTCVGNQAGANITTGYHNVVLGHRSGFEGNNITTGINNTLVGCFAKPSSSTVDGELILGRNARGQGGSTGSLGISGTGVHIAFNGSTTSWSAHSDERLKENIEDSTAGLSFINDLRPITYNWKSKKDISEDFVNYYDADSDEPVQGQVKQTNHGFIAQEIKTAIDAHPEIKEGHSIWRESPDGVQNVADGALMPMMVKAIQELSAKNDALEARIQELEG